MNNSLDQYRKSLWPLPQHSQTTEDKMRRLGVEIEFTGMEISDIVDTIISLYGGKAEAVSDYEINVVDTSLGKFGVELDFSYIKRISRERHESADNNDLEELAEANAGLQCRHHTRLSTGIFMSIRLVKDALRRRL